VNEPYDVENLLRQEEAILVIMRESDPPERILSTIAQRRRVEAVRVLVGRSGIAPPPEPHTKGIL
jgi:hypothetical protein